MIEKVFKLTKTENKIIEKVIQDENIHYVHMILNKDEGLPEHFANSTVYMTIVSGSVSIKLNDGEVNLYKNGTVLKIPFETKMNVFNRQDEILELIVVKAPAPKK
ncbi:cupin domain-containing protein [Helicovermis profundi]|uniref:Cupin domain-containing protein n=1 Tax=Helicovermis profundi TaxID=3065157 RepID=A0AAU9EQU9_9FIRM|nr:cupin domain-containing protein [Clostridia bacterium S502]